MPYRLTAPIGTDLSWQVQLADSQGDPITTYTTADVLSAQVWRGSDQPVLFAPSATWTDAAAGQCEVAITGDQTAALEAGDYQVRVQVNGTAIPDSDLSLTDSPGTAPLLASYCSYPDLLDYLPSVESLEKESEVEGFARQRYKAKTWTDNLIQRNRRNSTGYSCLGFGGPGFYGYNGSQDDPVLQGYLDQDRLIRSPLLVEMNTYKSLSLICSSQIGPDDKATVWQRMAARYHGMAESCACRCTAEIDINNDGYADIVIPCGRSSNR